MNPNFIKKVFLAAAILYCLSPIDAVPGPIDDSIFLILSFIAQKRLPQT